MYMLRQIIRQVFSDQLLSLITQLFIYNLGHDKKMSTLLNIFVIFMVAKIHTNKTDPVLPLLKRQNKMTKLIRRKTISELLRF